MNGIISKPVRTGKAALEWDEKFHQTNLGQAPERVFGFLQRLEPFQIFSLRDMYSFSPTGIYVEGYRLHLIQCELRKEHQKLGDEYKSPSPEIMELWERVIKSLTENYQSIGLQRTGERLRRIANKIEGFQWRVGPMLTEARELDLAITSDLNDHAFFHLPKDRVAHFRSDRLFGDEIYDAFEDIREDVKSAGTCFATELYTACVFHLMRAVERGAKVLAKEMKAERFLTITTYVKGKKKVTKRPIELCDWKTLIDALNNSLRILERGTKTNLQKKERLEFYSHAVAQFSNFKDAWRNNVSHGRKEYQPGEAADVMMNTRLFLGHLAKPRP